MKFFGLPRSARLGAVLTALAVVVTSCGGTDGAEPTFPLTTRGTPTPTAAAAPTTSDETVEVEAPELGGTDWVVSNYSQGPGVMTNVWKTDVTIAFAADGTFSGSAGCNDYEGTWTVSDPYDEFTPGVPDANDGQILTFDSLSWTEIACDDEDIMEQETEILDLLQRAGRWVLIREVFNLRDSEGAFLFDTEAA